MIMGDKNKQTGNEKPKEKSEVNNLYDLISDETTFTDCEGKSYRLKDFILNTWDKIFCKLPDNKDLS